MTASALTSAAAITARRLLGLGAWRLHALVLLAVALIALGGERFSAEQSWLQRSGPLALTFFVPGLWIALRLRDGWPGLGPGDEALPWLLVQAGPKAPEGWRFSPVCALAISRRGRGRW